MRPLAAYINEQLAANEQAIDELASSPLGKMIDIVDAFDKVHAIWSEVTVKVSPQGETIGKLLDRLRSQADQIISFYVLNAEDSQVRIELDADQIKSKKLVTILRSYEEWKELKKLNANLESTDFTNLTIQSLVIIFKRTVSEFIAHIE